MDRGQARGQPLVFFAGLPHRPARHQVLQLLVSAQAKHFLPAAGRIASPEVLVDDFKELLEFEGAFRREDVHQFFGDEIRYTT